jgi:tight adherence protein C
MLVLAHRLSLPRLKAWLRRRLIAAGSPNYYTAEEYLALALAGGVLAGLVLQVVTLMIWGQLSLFLMVLGLGVGSSLTIYQLHEKANERVQVIQRRLPYALDLIALAMGAGATFTEAVRTLASENDEDPLNSEFRALLAEIDLGTTRRRAMENLSARVPLESLENVIASVIQAEELGSPLTDVLRDQATVLRVRRSYEAENRAAIASVRMMVPSLLLVIAVLLAVFGPAALRLMREGMW